MGECHSISSVIARDSGCSVEVTCQTLPGGPDPDRADVQRLRRPGSKAPRTDPSEAWG